MGMGTLRQSQLQLRHVPNKLVDDKMLEAMLAMFVLAQRPSVKYWKQLSSDHDALK